MKLKYVFILINNVNIHISRNIILFIVYNNNTVKDICQRLTTHWY